VSVFPCVCPQTQPVPVDDAHAALEAVVKGALSTATGENLGLDNGVVTADVLGNLLGLGSVGRDTALGHADAVLGVLAS
jgi:hypothetical protein